ncbi:Shedu anti-phage system protein SduA domain-containing protein [Streptomyces echinatus]|uniref:Shedu anti-phage system protein SduA domain-containing protein n=1 Tax=Streptomyces echinatus TaxID=67293 RepID=UPI0037F439AF
MTDPQVTPRGDDDLEAEVRRAMERYGERTAGEYLTGQRAASTFSLHSSYGQYVQQVTKELLRSGHAKTCLHVSNATLTDIEAYEEKLSTATDERPLQEFLQEHPQVLALGLSSQCRWIIPQTRLSIHYVTDFLTARLDSTGLKWTFIELQSPREGLFTQKGRPSEHLDEGIRQILDWRTWVDDQGPHARDPKTRGGLGLVDISSYSRGLIIMGRRENVTDLDRKRLKLIMWNHQIDVRSYDSIAADARASLAILNEFPECEDGCSTETAV